MMKMGILRARKMTIVNLGAQLYDLQMVSLKTAPPPAVQQNTTDPEVRFATAKKNRLDGAKKL